MKTKTFHLTLLHHRKLCAAVILIFLMIAGCATSIGPGGGAIRVSVTTEDGVDLSAYKFGAGAVGVILSHMYTGNQENWWPFARILEDNGYKVLTYDFRGYRDSSGPTDIGKMDTDVSAILDFLREDGATKIFLIGADMGGTASISVASSQDVDGVVTISAPAILSQGVDITSKLPISDSPKLFIAAKDDVFSARNATLLYQNSTEPKELRIVAGSAHGTDMLTGEFGPRVQGLIMDFLRRYSE